jgi:hypothetical protein
MLAVDHKVLYPELYDVTNLALILLFVRSTFAAVYERRNKGYEDY